ncbi:hypothetical protein Patl1_26632 [Pistacia atlantica]|uniref:Uncharacterized protein n=1 Tax=Pistacia atlantica TaxID=434234 RepID=A0ACC1B4A2_9ROSI|nr:hypothetical protein Patl1_26632 [Pistacia atlantica]
MSTNKKFKNKNLCGHPFCLDCIAKYIEFKIEDHTANIQCPGLNCQQVLDPLSCRAIISQSVFSKWCDLLCDNYVLGFERSYCPGTNCMEVVVNECGGTVKKSKCPNCKRLFCFQCKLAWHAGYGCAESRNMRDRNDILFGQLVERNTWTRCPGCGHCIELREGCKSVKCRCNTWFCYKCGKELHTPLFICECSQNSCHCWHFTVTVGSFILVLPLIFYIVAVTSGD